MSESGDISTQVLTFAVSARAGDAADCRFSIKKMPGLMRETHTRMDMPPADGAGASTLSSSAPYNVCLMLSKSSTVSCTSSLTTYNRCSICARTDGMMFSLLLPKGCNRDSGGTENQLEISHVSGVARIRIPTMVTSTVRKEDTPAPPSIACSSTATISPKNSLQQRASRGH
jgi:hypothetical protein